MLRDRVVVVGVSGGIAAYKACELVRRLRERGATVIVVMTPAAQEFVGALTFQALSGNPVVTHMWGDQKQRFSLPLESRPKQRGHVEHVDVAEIADALVIAPATADLIARMVHGVAPDALTAIALATRAPMVVAPAMDLQMWRAAATQDNMRTLRARGAAVVGPASGALASGLAGPGRLAEIDDIVVAVERVVTRSSSLRGQRVVVSAGRTEEPIDPVRVLTNRSSGKMGFAIAEAARDRGADVTLLAGHTSVEPPHGVTLVRFGTALELQAAAQRAVKGASMVIMAAAVGDYRVAKEAAQKLKRSGDELTLKLTPNPDVLAGLGAKKAKGQLLVGFALETNNGLANARKKLSAKRADLIVLNTPQDGIGGDTNMVTLVDADMSVQLPRASKREVAEAILDRASDLRGAGSGAKRATRKKRA
jgi:phosphopantothenoylcysteine decarboxylase/phosphopantothenate--cysteine ligase